MVEGGAERALAVAGKLRLFVSATSLGGVESLVEHRATIEGPDSPVPPQLLRMSIGVEHVDDLIADLEQALTHLTNYLYLSAMSMALEDASKSLAQR